MAKWKGQWRIAGQNGKPNLVSVIDGDMTWDDVDEDAYHLHCIQPPLEDLPWRGGVKPSAPVPLPPTQPIQKSKTDDEVSQHPNWLSFERLALLNENLTADERAELLTWEKVNVKGDGVTATTDWPGWQAVIARVSH
ncbi:MAG: hypothetical protein K2X55_12335 [Burkholderiaceae bacterium]|nr:hypothetical protein [Burkholderiaceae bacterium]